MFYSMSRRHDAGILSVVVVLAMCRVLSTKFIVTGIVEWYLFIIIVAFFIILCCVVRQCVVTC